MKIIECPQEQDVIAAVMSRRWPDRCDANLRAHVGACSICRDVAEVAVAFGADQDAFSEDTKVPTAAHMWWRLQMRARQDAARAARRPIAVAQAFVAAAIGGLGVAAIGFGLATGSWSISEMGSGLQPAANAVVGSLVSLAATPPHTTLVFGAIAAGLVLMPVAVYLALSE
jgi:hypothetical protein